MTSFIEVPMLSFDGRDVPSVYVNVADIITIRSEYDGRTRLEIRDLGSEGCSAALVSFLEIGSFLNVLGLTAEHPGVKSWDPNFLEVAKAKVRPLLQEAAAREREASRR